MTTLIFGQLLTNLLFSRQISSKNFVRIGSHLQVLPESMPNLQKTKKLREPALNGDAIADLKNLKDILMLSREGQSNALSAQREETWLSRLSANGP